MTISILTGDCRDVLKTLPSESVHCCVTSPPYFGLRDYGVAGQIGLEPTPEEYTQKLVLVFREVRRVLRKDGTLWINLGDSYSGGKTGRSDHGMNDPTVGLQGNSGGAVHVGYAVQRPVPVGMKPKDLIGIPWLVAFALRLDGWYLRQDIIWSKPNPMPESVRDRCTKAHEYIFLLSKSERYYYDHAAIQEPALRPEGAGNTKPYVVANERPGENANIGGGLHKVGPREVRNKRSVWEVTTAPYADAHFATFPPALIEPCILAGCPEGGTILDPFGGAGTTALVADRAKRNAIIIELNPEYAAMADRRVHGDAPLFAVTETAIERPAPAKQEVMGI